MDDFIIGALVSAFLGWWAMTNILLTNEPLDLGFGAPIYKCKVLQE